MSADRCPGQVFGTLRDRWSGQDPTPRMNTGRTGAPDRWGQVHRTSPDRWGCVRKDTPAGPLASAVDEGSADAMTGPDCGRRAAPSAPWRSVRPEDVLLAVVVVLNGASLGVTVAVLAGAWR